jgi:hypothetical protein
MSSTGSAAKPRVWRTIDRSAVCAVELRDLRGSALQFSELSVALVFVGC